MSFDWLPPLVLLADAGGDWHVYEEVLYGCFKRDFVDSLPFWPGKRVGLKRYPLSKGKEATFWHFISTGESEADREIDLRRCERIRWPRPMMEAFPNKPPPMASPVLWWKSQRGTEWRYVLTLADFSYVVVVADRGEYVLPWTTYHVEHDHQRKKLRLDYEDFWQNQKC